MASTSDSGQGARHPIDSDALRTAYRSAAQLLLDQRVMRDGQPAHWEGELSTSALSTATAVMSLLQVCKAGRSEQDFDVSVSFGQLIARGIAWLVAHQNPDGGWGDTTKSISNISTSMLCHAVLHFAGTEAVRATHSAEIPADVVRQAKAYVDRIGGTAAVRKRYGKDKTFSVPILTHCALAGLVDWSEVSSLPFELSCLPARFYAAVKLPVVSYALPALIAIGQVKFHFRPTWNPITRVLRRLAIGPSLKVLERIQPPNGGFLEATPLTSFVTMSLVAKGLVDHQVVRRGVRFLCASVRPDGSWPIDTNLATWVTTLAINALGPDVPEGVRPALLDWLLKQQYREVHPFTNAAPGGWAWTDLPGGVPDADDTPGAMLALLRLTQATDSKSESRAEVLRAIANGTQWLNGLQNRDGGFPTFCRGWGTLPFDRSSPDITAHCLRAIASSVKARGWTDLRVQNARPGESLWTLQAGLVASIDHNIKLHASDFEHCEALRQLKAGFQFLNARQRADGAWLPLWFGNQHAHDDENPTYGTSRVLLAYRDCEFLDSPEAQLGASFLASIQNTDGGWGGAAGMESSVEETALACEALLSFKSYRSQAFDGIGWLMARVADGTLSEPSPVGFYFAKLWYFERLYPLVFAVSALRRAVEANHENSVV